MIYHHHYLLPERRRFMQCVEQGKPFQHPNPPERRWWPPPAWVNMQALAGPSGTASGTKRARAGGEQQQAQQSRARQEWEAQLRQERLQEWLQVEWGMKQQELLQAPSPQPQPSGPRSHYEAQHNMGLQQAGWQLRPSPVHPRAEQPSPHIHSSTAPAHHHACTPLAHLPVVQSNAVDTGPARTLPTTQKPAVTWSPATSVQWPGYAPSGYQQPQYMMQVPGEWAQHPLPPPLQAEGDMGRSHEPSPSRHHGTCEPPVISVLAQRSPHMQSGGIQEPAYAARAAQPMASPLPHPVHGSHSGDGQHVGPSWDAGPHAAHTPVTQRFTLNLAGASPGQQQVPQLQHTMQQQQLAPQQWAAQESAVLPQVHQQQQQQQRGQLSLGSKRGREAEARLQYVGAGPQQVAPEQSHACNAGPSTRCAPATCWRHGSAGLITPSSWAQQSPHGHSVGAQAVQPMASPLPHPLHSSRSEFVGQAGPQTYQAAAHTHTHTSETLRLVPNWVGASPGQQQVPQLQQQQAAHAYQATVQVQQHQQRGREADGGGVEGNRSAARNAYTPHTAHAPAGNWTPPPAAQVQGVGGGSWHGTPPVAGAHGPGWGAVGAAGHAATGNGPTPTRQLHL